jgi:hypothetical protein
VGGAAPRQTPKNQMTGRHNDMGDVVTTRGDWAGRNDKGGLGGAEGREILQMSWEGGLGERALGA